VFNGVVDSETPKAIVLNMAEGKKSIGRAKFEQLKINDISLLPEGIEKDTQVQDMTNLLEYLTKSESPRHPNPPPRQQRDCPEIKYISYSRLTCFRRAAVKSKFLAVFLPVI